MNFLSHPIFDNLGSGHFTLRVRPEIVCVDGAKVSVQASGFHYCTPRDNIGPYTTVEVGFPTMPFPDGLPYKEDLDADDSATVFARVPVKIIGDWIESHGGIDYAKMIGI